MSLTAQGLLAELDTTLPQATEFLCSAALRQIADLFVASADNYNDEQVALFGEVIGRLIPNTGRRQLAELSNLLAQARSAPVNVVGLLARHIDIAVCGPVLERAAALPDSDLVQIADNDRTNMNMLMKIAVGRNSAKPSPTCCSSAAIAAFNGPSSTIRTRGCRKRVSRA